MHSFLLWDIVRAVEVATFPSGRSVLRWADSSEFQSPHHAVGREHHDVAAPGERARDLARFGIVPGRSSSTYASIVLSCPTDASPPRLMNPPSTYGGIAEVHGEIRWFLDWLGVRVLMKDWDEPRWRGHKPTLSLIRKAEPVVGTPLFPADEAEVFALLGNPVPFLWPAEAFARWADDLRGSAAPSPLPPHKFSIELLLGQAPRCHQQ